MAKEQNILNTKIEELTFSEGLKKILHFKNIHTLSDILKIETHNWQKKISGFNYHHQQEIMNYIKEYKLEQYLKED